MRSSGIVSFIDAVRHRLDRGLLVKTGAVLLVGSAAACVLWALGWRIGGYAAPWIGYCLLCGMALLAGAAWWMKSRASGRSAAGVADRTFGLKDGLVSWLDFSESGRTGEVYVLHDGRMSTAVAALDTRAVPVPRPRRMIAAGGVLAVVAVALALLPHSAAVRKRLALEAETSSRSAEISKQVEKAMEEILGSLDEDEKKLIDENKLREWAKRIEQTKDMREAEKQLARLEQQLAATVQGLEARQDEAMLKLAGEELEKSQVADARQLGKELDAKNFDKAAEGLKEMKPGEKPKLTPEELEKLKEKSAKAKEMAKRMADGARKRDFGKMKQGNAKDPGALKPADGNQQPMQEMLEDMDAAARDLDQELGEAGEFDEDAERALGRMNGEMDKLGKRLGQLGARQKAKGKLDALRQGLGAARQFAQGQSQQLGLAESMSQGQQPGGQKAGVGTDASRRAERDELKDNGNLAETKAQQNNEGPSTTTLESAESGSGVAGRSNVAKDREFKQQYESLVRRDDVPESLKLGVRDYFERVHETAEEGK